MAERWVVVEYDSIDIRTVQDAKDRTVPGEITGAMVVTADSEAGALEVAAQRPGYFAAFSVPPGIRPTQLVLVQKEKQ